MTQANKKAGTHVAVSRNGIAAGSPATIDAATGGFAPVVGSRLVLRVGAFIRAATTATVTDNQASGGNAWNQEVFHTVLSGGNRISTSIWTCTVTQTVSSPFTVNFNPVTPGGTHFSGLILDEIENYDTTTYIEAAGAGSTNTGSTMSADISNTTNDCLKLGIATWWNTNSGTPVSGNTLAGWTGDGIDESNAIQAALAVYAGFTGPDTSDPTATLTGGDTNGWSMSGIAIRGAASAAAVYTVDRPQRNRPGRGPYSKGAYKRPDYPAYTDSAPVVSVSAAPGVWTWAGSSASLSGGTGYVEQSPRRNRPGRGPYSLGAYFRPHDPNKVDTSSQTQIINAVVGAWTWVGTTASTLQLVSATPGTWTWVGTTAGTSQLVSATPGAYTWSGSTASLTQLISATPGTWIWAGTQANINGSISATPGTWTWAGTTASTTQLVNATPGTWTWVGASASLTQLVSATPGAYSWTGTQANINGALNATPGTWTWTGTTAATSQLINATPGAWTWGGTTAATSQLIAATAGAWTWQGVNALILVQGTISAVPGAWTWTGTRASIAVGAVTPTWPAGGPARIGRRRITAPIRMVG